MEIAAQTTALFFAGGDQPFARALQIACQLHGMNRNSGLARKIVQQSMIGRAEGFVRGTRCKQQMADRFVTKDQRKRQCYLSARPSFRDDEPPIRLHSLVRAR